MTDGGPVTLHATCVADGGRGLLILGPSGSGKSALALQMMALGAVLVADDRVVLTRAGPRLIAACPPALAGLVEARGVGLLRAPAADPVAVALAADLGQPPGGRLPPCRRCDLLGLAVDLVAGPLTPHLGPALLQLLRHGRAA